MWLLFNTVQMAVKINICLILDPLNRVPLNVIEWDSQEIESCQGSFLLEEYEVK